MKKLLAGLFFIAVAAAGQVQHPDYVGTIAGLPTCNSAREGLFASVNNGDTASADCSTTGTDTVPCYCDGTTWQAMGGAGGSDGVGYDEVLEEGSGLTKRAQLNFIGSSITCADNAGNTRTDCTLTGGGYDTIEDEDSGLTQRTTLNFEGAGVSCADDTTKTTCTISGGGGGTITVREVDGTPSVSSVDTVEFTEADGFVVTDQTGGVARVANSSVPLSSGRTSETFIRGLITDPASPDRGMTIQGSGDTSNNTNDATVVVEQARYITVDPLGVSSRDSYFGIGAARDFVTGSNANTGQFMIGNSVGNDGVLDNPSWGLWATQHLGSVGLEKSRFAIRTFGESSWQTVISHVNEYNANGGDHISIDGETFCFGVGCGEADDLTDDEHTIKGNIDFPGFGSDPHINIPSDATPPGTCVQGDMVYDSTADALKVCVDTSYQLVGGGGTPPPKCLYIENPVCNGATATQTLAFQAFAAGTITESSCVTETNGGTSMTLDLQICDSDGSSNCTGNFGPTCGEVGTSTGNATHSQSISDNEWVRVVFTCTTDGHDWASVCFQYE